MSRLLEKYRKEIVPKLQQEFNLRSPMAVPRIIKVVINVGIGEIGKDEVALKKTSDYLAALSGQKIRAGYPVGLLVTLRGKRAFDFLDRLFSLVLPRVRDFRGLKKNAFDGSGNYTLGLTEQIIFPEVKYDKIDKVRGLEISIVTTASENQKAKRLLEEMGMPFEKYEK